MEEIATNNNSKTIFDDLNKEHHYFSVFESYSYFPKPSNYVMEQVKVSSNSNNDIIDEKIVKSTLEGLVIHLTNPIDSVDYNALQDFFIVYRDFMSSERLLEIILYRLKWSITKILPITTNNSARAYNTNSIPTLHSANNVAVSDDETLIKLYAIIVIRVFVMVRHWITNYFIEDFLYNDTLFYSFVTFFDNDLAQNLLPLVLGHGEHKNLKMVSNCIVTLKKQWVHKLNECFTESYYKNMPNSNSTEEWIKYSLTIYDNNEDTKLHNSKRLSIFALKNSTDPTARNQSFLNIIGKRPVRLPNASDVKSNFIPSLQEYNGVRNAPKSKQSILFPKNFNYMAAYRGEQPLRNTSDDSNTITPNYRNFSGLSNSKNTSVISDSKQQMNVIDIPKNNKRMISLSTNNDSLRESETSSGRLDFVQVLNVPETSTIDMILPSTPAKKLEFTISLDDLIGEHNKSDESQSEQIKTISSDLSVRQSIYGLLNKWGTIPENIHKPSEEPIDESMSVVSVEQTDATEDPSVKHSIVRHDVNEVNKFVRYVFSIAAITNKNDIAENATELKNKEYVENLIKEGEHRFDILSARSIDEVQYIINRESDQLKNSLDTPLKSNDDEGDVELSQMDNLNLYNTVVQMANSVLSSTMKNNLKNNNNLKRFSKVSSTDNIQTTPLHFDSTIVSSQSAAYTSPEKSATNHLNFVTSPFLRSVEKTKTDFANRDWVKRSPSVEKQASMSRDVDLEEEPDYYVSRDAPLTPTPAKHISNTFDEIESGLVSKELKLKLPDSKTTTPEDTTTDEELEANETILELPVSSAKATPVRSFSDSFSTNGHMRNASVQSYQSMYSFIKQDLPKARNSGRISISSGQHNHQNGNKKRYGSLSIPKSNDGENYSNTDAYTSDDQSDFVNHIRNKSISRTPSLLKSPSFVDKDELFQQQENELRQLSAKISSTSLRKKSFNSASKSLRNSANNLNSILDHSRDITPFEPSPINVNGHIKMSPTFTNINNLIANPKELSKMARLSLDEKGSGSGVSSINTDLLFHDAVSSQDNTIPQKNSFILNDVRESTIDVPKRWTAGLNLHLSDLEPLAEQEDDQRDDDQIAEIENLYEDSDKEEQAIEPSTVPKQTDLRQMFQQQFQNADGNSHVSDSCLSFMIYGEDNLNEEIEEYENAEKKHNLEARPEEITTYNDDVIEESYTSHEEHFDNTSNVEKNFQGENPLELAMRKLEGTFQEIENESNSDDQEVNSEECNDQEYLNNKEQNDDFEEEEKEFASDYELDQVKTNNNTIAKSKSVNNMFNSNKRSSILNEKRRKTLLSTTELDSYNNKKQVQTSSTAQRDLATSKDTKENEISTGMYINDLLSDYTIKDHTLLITNFKEHIPFILMYSSRDIAQQMTLIERDVLNEVDWKSLLQLQMDENLKSYTSWLEVLVNQDELSGIDLGVARFNLTVDWIISEIVLTKAVKLKRNILQKYIHVAEHCIKLQNFNTSMQIVLALSSIEVQHFKESWRLVEPGDMLIWAEMKNLFSSEYDDYKGLRELMNDMEPIRGCLPFLVLYLSDLKNLANTSTFFHSNHDIVNYQKFHSLASIVKNFIQRVNWGIEFYQLELNPQLLSKCLYISALKEHEIAKIINNGYD